MLWAITALALTADGGVSLDDYEAARATLTTTREALFRRWAVPAKRAEARGEAREALLRYFDEVAFPAWAGTRWDFYGKTEVPRAGAIACGYFVTTVLAQAGLRIQRDWLAQQVSATLVSTLAAETEVLWLRYLERAEVVARVRAALGDGLFVVGLDLHTGFLRLAGGRADFCHSSYLEPGTVLCEPAAGAAAFASKLYVVGEALPDGTIDAWLQGKAIASVPAKWR